MKYKSINFITSHLSEIINKDADLIIKNICEDYSLDYKNAKKKYINNNSINNNIKNMLDSKIRCLGIIKSGCQCARTRKNNSEFCLIHQKSLKFGKKHNFYPNVDSPE
tara:strand:+ start:5703 stop:6026 length:324 start_codon:yes stop_codon:yes gene_type:complete